MRLSHSFSVELAEKYGIECAILISHFQFWIEQNQAMGRNYHDGRTWMYQTQKEIAAIYPYWSEDTVQRTIKKLEEHKIIIKGNYNKSSFDRTVWYAFENEEMFTKPRNRGIEKSKSNDPNRGIAPPIPDTNPDTKQSVVCAAEPPVAEPPPLKEIINSHKTIEKQHPDGSKYSISQDDIISHGVISKKDWTLPEIDEVWQILKEYKNPIRNWQLFCDGTIKKLRIMKALKKHEKTEDKKCKKNTKTTDSSVKASNKQLENSTEKTTVPTTKTYPLANWRQMVGMPPRSNELPAT